MSQAGISSISALPTVATSFVEDVGSATPSFNIINVLGGIGTNTEGSGNTITINTNGAGYLWQAVTAVDNPVLMTPSYGYISKDSSAVQFYLPPTAAVGDIFRIEGWENLWVLNQNAFQSIKIGTRTTTIGAGGSITATVATDSITILCVTTDTEFKIIDWNGNPTVV